MYFYTLVFNPYALTYILIVKPFHSLTLSEQICLQRQNLFTKKSQQNEIC